MKKSWKKLPKWAKVVLWILGILIGFKIIICIVLGIWVSTWPVHKEKDFSIRYPTGWYSDYGFSAPSRLPYTYNITTPPKAIINGYDFSDISLWTFLNVFDKNNIKRDSIYNLDRIANSGIRLRDGVYLRLSFPTSVEFSVIKGDRVYNALSEVNTKSVNNIFARIYYWLNGLLIGLSLDIAS